jgi:GAF domain-containing protein
VQPYAALVADIRLTKRSDSTNSPLASRAGTNTDNRICRTAGVLADLLNHTQFYAAAPIITADGHHLGTVAVMDTEPRAATPEQLATLADLAAVVMDKLELRLAAMNTMRNGH